MVCIFATHKNVEFTEWSNFTVSYCWKHATRLQNQIEHTNRYLYLTFLDLGFMLLLVAFPIQCLEVLPSNFPHKHWQQGGPSVTSHSKVWEPGIDCCIVLLIRFVTAYCAAHALIQTTKTHRLQRLMRLSKLLLKFSNWLPPIMGHLSGS